MSLTRASGTWWYRFRLTCHDLGFAVWGFGSRYLNQKKLYTVSLLFRQTGGERYLILGFEVKDVGSVVLCGVGVNIGALGSRV